MGGVLEDCGFALLVVVLGVLLGLHEGELLLGDPFGFDGSLLLLFVFFGKLFLDALNGISLLLIVLLEAQSGFLRFLGGFGCLLGAVLLDLGEDPVLVEFVLEVADVPGAASLLASLVWFLVGTLPVVGSVIENISGFLLAIVLVHFVIFFNVS